MYSEIILIRPVSSKGKSIASMVIIVKLYFSKIIEKGCEDMPPLMSDPIIRAFL